MKLFLLEDWIGPIYSITDNPLHNAIEVDLTPEEVEAYENAYIEFLMQLAKLKDKVEKQYE